MFFLTKRILISATVLVMFPLMFLINCSGYQDIVMTRQYPSELSQRERENMLSEHNKWRQQVGVSPLKWSYELEETARDWALKLSLNYNCKMIHSNSKFGENIFWASKPVSVKYVVDSWAEERFNYNYSSNSCKVGKVCGHYTQIIWRETKNLGCARAFCRDGGQIWVCNYEPAGNIVGKKPY